MSQRNGWATRVVVSINEHPRFRPKRWQREVLCDFDDGSTLSLSRGDGMSGYVPRALRVAKRPATKRDGGVE